jgi:hypothetical protein
MRVKARPVVTCKVIIVPILLSLPRRNVVTVTVVVIVTMLLRLPGRHASMSWGWIVRIVSRRTLRNADAGGSQQKYLESKTS